MNQSIDFKIAEEPGIGVVLQLLDRDRSDQFEDYLTEQRFAFFKLQESPSGLRFLFGEASSLDKVSDLFRAFEANALGNI